MEMSDQQKLVERVVMRNAAQFEHPVFGVYFHEATREVFIFDTMSPDLTNPASAVRYIVEGDFDAPGTLRLRCWREGDATFGRVDLRALPTEGEDEPER